LRTSALFELVKGLGFTREPAAAVAHAVIAGIEEDACRLSDFAHDWNLLVDPHCHGRNP
jgi:hypothetical protein